MVILINMKAKNIKSKSNLAPAYYESFLNLLQWLLGLQKSSWHFYTHKKWLCVMKASKHEPKLKTVDNDNLLCITTLVQIRVGTSGEISGSRNLQLGSTQHYCMLGRAANDPPVSTIMKNALTRAFSYLKAPISTFTFKTDTIYTEQAL